MLEWSRQTAEHSGVLTASCLVSTSSTSASPAAQPLPRRHSSASTCQGSLRSPGQLLCTVRRAGIRGSLLLPPSQPNSWGSVVQAPLRGDMQTVNPTGGKEIAHMLCAPAGMSEPCRAAPPPCAPPQSAAVPSCTHSLQVKERRASRIEWRRVHGRVQASCKEVHGLTTLEVCSCRQQRAAAMNREFAVQLCSPLMPGGQRLFLRGVSGSARPCSAPCRYKCTPRASMTTKRCKTQPPQRCSAFSNTPLHIRRHAVKCCRPIQRCLPAGPVLQLNPPSKQVPPD